jgi:hypothetical protein
MTSPAINSTVEERIQELEALGREDNVEIKSSSQDDLLSFIREHDARRPALSLTDRGLLRAVWKNRYSEHPGLTFRGDGTVNYVLWYLQAGNIKRVHGHTFVEEVVSIMREEDVDLIPILHRD